MKLLKLVLKNFKGKSFELNANGCNVSIYGDNATGKTTVADAWSWLLCNKDSSGEELGENIKNRDKSGEFIHFLEHSVEAIVEHNNHTTELKKSYKEKWSRKRGNVTDEMSGHTTDYYIDGVPKSKKDYDQFISTMADDSLFKLLTNPMYFNVNLHWTKRREILMDICGDISDADVIASKESLQGLSAILGKRSLEDHRKVINARMTVINDKKKEIPARIDEVSQAIPDVNGIDIDSLIKKSNTLQGEIDAKNAEIALVKNGGKISEEQIKLREAESKLIDLQNRHKIRINEKTGDKYSRLVTLKAKLGELKSDIQQKNRLININESSIAEGDSKLASLRTQARDLHRSVFIAPDTATECPTCGQSIPEHLIAKAAQKAEAVFNVTKAEKEAAIIESGKKLRSNVDSLKEENLALNKEIEFLNGRIDELEIEITLTQSEINSLINDVGSLDNDPEYIAVIANIAAITENIKNNSLQQSGIIAGIMTELSSIVDQKRDIDQSIARFEQHIQCQTRIRELKAQEKDLNREYLDLEAELNLTDEFVRAKVNLLESKINSKFRFARFKLFHQQINGGLTECCTTMIDGVPFGSGLNQASEINSGLDIINTLSEHYGFTAPIFVDNAESVTQLIETNAQVIRLIVSKPDHKLRVENDNEVPSLFKEAV